MRTSLLLVACAGCEAYLRIDGAAGSGTTGAGQSGTAESTGTTGEPTTGEPTTGAPTTGEPVCVPPTGASGEVLVAVPLTGDGNQHVRAVAVDDAGDTYIAGFFSDTLALHDAAVTAGPGSPSAFVARLDCAGELVWLNAARSGDAGASSQGHALSLHDGRVYLGGELTGPVSFRDGEPLPGGAGRAFIAGFDVADGAPADVTLFDAETTAVRGMVIDDGGQLHAVGGCDGAGKVPQGLLLATWSGQAEPGAHVCEFTDVLEPADAVTTALAVALAADGGLVLGGQLSAAVMGWHEPAIAAGSSRGFIARIDPPIDLAAPVVPAWLATLGTDGFGNNRVNAVALRDQEVVAAARGVGLTQLQGEFDTDCGVDCAATTGFDVHNTAVVQLRGDGSCIGERVLCSDTEASDEFWSVVTAVDTIYVTGQFDGSLLLGGEDLTDAPRPAGVRTFVLGLPADPSESAGAWALLSGEEEDTECGFIDEQAKTSDTRSIMRGAAIAADPGGLVVAGSVCGPGVSLGAATFTPGPQSYDGFVVKLAR